MTTAFGALHARLIDYAGLFPPAALGLDAAVETYDRHRLSTQRWMLGRFVCPLGKVDALAERIGNREPFELSLILPPSEDSRAFLENLGVAFEAQRRHEGKIVIGAFEAVFPQGIINLDDARGFLEEVRGELRRYGGLGENTPFSWEVPLTVDSQGSLELLAAAISAFDGGRANSLKLRCGGASSGAFPSTAMVVAAIRACRNQSVPFKATAGLHHPLPREDEALGVRMHGFWNLFGAAILANAGSFDESTLGELIDDADPSSFAFDVERFAWRDFTVTTEEIRVLRKTRAWSFGSCSFDEPCEDLLALGHELVE